MQRAATSHNKPQRTTTSHNKPQRATTNRNHPKRATTTHDEPQRPKRSNNEPQRPTTSHKEQQQATTTHNDPQLRHKMIKTHKKLHSLVYALSPLNPYLPGFWWKKFWWWYPKPAAHAVAFWLLVLIQCLGIILFVFGNVFERVILWTRQLKG